MLAGPLLAVALATAPAEAGACCVGSTSTVPTRLGECERWLGGLSLGAERAVGRWDSSGGLAASSLEDDALVATLAGAYRWDRKGQVGVVLPLRLNHKGAGDVDLWGGGAGDLVATLLWDPLTELPRGTGQAAWPVPLLSVGARLPTGRTWQQASGELLEDVTGRPGPGALLGLGIERTLDRTPWSLGVDGELAPDGDHLHPTVGFSGAIGRYLGTRWSLTATARHQRSYVLDGDGSSTSRTVIGAKLTTSRPVRWRAWIGGEADLPLPLAGHANQRLVAASLGAAVLR